MSGVEHEHDPANRLRRLVAEPCDGGWLIEIGISRRLVDGVAVSQRIEQSFHERGLLGHSLEISG